MNPEILRHLLYSALCWAVFLGLYKGMIVQSGTIRQQRIFLIGSLISGTLIPLLFWPQSHLSTLVVTLPEVWVSPVSTSKEASQESFNWLHLLVGVYVLGLIAMISRFFLGLYQLYLVQRTSPKQMFGEKTVYRLPSPAVPFQFFNALYLPEYLEPASTEFQMAFDHELAHSRLGHSQDLMLGHILRIVFWFQPLVHILVKELRLVHEFEADQRVIRDQDRDKYVRFIGTFKPAPHPVLPIHTIIQGPLKTRIIHMYQPTKPWKFHHATIVGLTVLALVGFTSFSNVTLPVQNELETNFTTSIDSAGPNHKTSTLGDDNLFKVVENMPRFPGCEEDGLSGSELEGCSQNKLFNYIYTNLTYPKEAIDKGIEGTTITSFIVEKDGALSNVNIIRDIGGGTRDAVLHIFKQMESEGIRWIPGTQGGNKVRVEFKLPIKFKLTDDGDKSKSKKKGKEK